MNELSSSLPSSDRHVGAAASPRGLTIDCGEGKHDVCGGFGTSSYLIPQTAGERFECACPCHEQPAAKTASELRALDPVNGASGSEAASLFDLETGSDEERCWRGWRWPLFRKWVVYMDVPISPRRDLHPKSKMTCPPPGELCHPSEKIKFAR